MTEAMHVTDRATAFLTSHRERGIIRDVDDDAFRYHLALLLKAERQAAARAAVFALRQMQSLVAEGIPTVRFGERMHEIHTLARAARREIEEGDRPFIDPIGVPNRGIDDTAEADDRRALLFFAALVDAIGGRALLTRERLLAASELTLVRTEHLSGDIEFRTTRAAR